MVIVASGGNLIYKLGYSLAYFHLLLESVLLFFEMPHLPAQVASMVSVNNVRRVSD